MTTARAAVALTALVALGCGADRTTNTEVATATPVATAATAPLAPPTTTPLPTVGELEPSSPPPAPTPTTRVIGPVGPPSDAARLCTESGLVAAALDACLRYVGAGCTVADTGDACGLARDQLEVVLGTRIFPSDCADLADAELSGAPRWCSGP